MSRFHADLFCEGPADDVLCSICQDVLDEPLELPCRHTFCCVCIRSVEPKECPLCRQPYQETDLKEPAVALQNLLRNLKMRCQNEACDQIIALEEYCLHQARCNFGSVGCPHTDCEHQMYRKDVEQHKAVCGYRPVSCPYGCGDTVQHRNTDHHFYTFCIMGKRTCYKCECVYLYQEREKHDCIRYLKGEISTIKAAHQDHQDRMKYMEGEIHSLKGDHTDHQDRMKYMEGEIQSLKGDHKDRINQMSEEIQQLKDENSVLREDLKSGRFCQCPKRLTQKLVASLKSPPRSARLRKSFNAGQHAGQLAGRRAGQRADQRACQLIDAALVLRGGLILVYSRHSLMCFNIEGHLLHQTPVENYINGNSLADIGGGQVVHYNSQRQLLQVLKVSAAGIREKGSVKTGKRYSQLTAFDSQTLAAVAGRDCQPRQCSIDLLSVKGLLIQSIAINGDVYSLCSTRDGGLLYGVRGEIIKVDITTGTEVLRKKFSDADPHNGFTTTMDGSILACDVQHNSILMLDSDGNHMKIMYTLPEDDHFNLLTRISLFDNIVVCYTDNDRLHVIELEY